MSGLPEVCTAKEHLEQNLQRRGKTKVLGSCLPWRLKSSCTGFSSLLGRAGHRGRPGQDRVPQPRLSLKKSFAREILGRFLPYPHFSTTTDTVLLLTGGRLSLYNKA